MIARAIESIFYSSAVNGTHRAMSDMGFIPDGSHGTPAEQVRAAIHGTTVEAIAAPPADEDADKPRTRAKGGKS
jgi:hypothetical protein